MVGWFGPEIPRRPLSSREGSSETDPGLQAQLQLAWLSQPRACGLGAEASGTGKSSVSRLKFAYQVMLQNNFDLGFYWCTTEVDYHDR